MGVRVAMTAFKTTGSSLPVKSSSPSCEPVNNEKNQSITNIKIRKSTLSMSCWGQYRKLWSIEFIERVLLKKYLLS